jgi:hypothetical protein
VAIPGATNATLVISTVTTNDSANYRLVASNAAGSAASNEATLTVTSASAGNSAPIIQQQPGSQTVASLETVTFASAATGNPAPSYQWQRNGVAIPGATNATLVISTVTTNDSANYRLVASNAAGSAASNEATLTVTSASAGNSAPVIQQHPANQAAMTGSNATFSAQASGSPTPSWQWYRNGAPIAGATNTTLVFTVSPGDAGLYSAVARNAAGEAGTNTATLSVTTPAPAYQAPVITRQPLSQEIVTGGNVTLVVEATGDPAPTYQWEKNGSPLTGATNPALQFYSVSSNDTASFRVVVSNAGGSVTSASANLTITAAPPVGVAPAFTQHPASVNLTFGGYAIFEARASGSPAPSYQWYKNGVAIANATEAVFSFAVSSYADAGAYAVVARNVAGEVWSNSAYLNVNAPTQPQEAPIITSQPQDKTAVFGGTVTFEVAAQGNPAPTFQWQRNGADIPGATSATLTLSNLSKGDAAAYAVKVSNTAGVVTSAAVYLTLVY